jgi:hypothetical protein
MSSDWMFATCGAWKNHFEEDSVFGLLLDA